MTASGALICQRPHKLRDLVLANLPNGTLSPWHPVLRRPEPSKPSWVSRGCEPVVGLWLGQFVNCSHVGSCEIPLLCGSKYFLPGDTVGAPFWEMTPLHLAHTTGIRMAQ